MKNNSSVIFIECTKMNRKTVDVNGFCISILLSKMGWYLGVIGKIHNNDFKYTYSQGKLKMVLHLYFIKHCTILGIND